MNHICDNTQFQKRTTLLLGETSIQRLAKSRVLVVGLGGVGGYAAELICRAGVGAMTIVDSDIVEATNLNRQLPALTSNIGISKAQVMAKRLLDINPELDLTVLELFVRDNVTDEVLQQHSYDYIVDAIDTLSPKINLISKCMALKLPLVSSMGAGGKVDPCKVTIADISKSYNCALAKVLRKKLRKRGVYKGFKVVFSPEEVPKTAVEAFQDEETGVNGSTVGTISYMPAIFGCHCASVVIRNLVNSPLEQ